MFIQAVGKRGFDPPWEQQKSKLMVDYEGTAIGEHLQLCARIICEKKLGSSAMVFPGIIGPATLEALTCREALALALDLSLQKNCCFMRPQIDCLRDKRRHWCRMWGSGKPLRFEHWGVREVFSSHRSML